MRRFEWNALRVGDQVKIHEKVGSPLAAGTVRMVDVQHGSNGVGIGMGARPIIIWPSRTAVHLSHFELGEPCWRRASLPAA